MSQPLQPVLAVIMYHCYTIMRSDGQSLVGLEPPTTTTKMLSPEELKKIYMQEVQKQHPEYNPHPGYEPYWPQGAWVFEDDEMNKYGFTTKMVTVCGEECNYLFKSVQKVCAKQVHTLSSSGCTPNLFSSCDGYYPDSLHGFRTFNTYCQFLDVQCRQSFSYYWILVHVGSCLHQDEVFKPVQHSGAIINRLYKYLSTLEVVFANKNLPSPLRQTSPKRA